MFPVQFSQFVQKGKHRTECQDKTHSSCINDIASISLADGAGSCKHAGKGALAVCNNIHRYMSKNFERFDSSKPNHEMRGFIVADIRHELDGLASELGCNVIELGSTLLYAGTDGYKLVIIHLGDGWIFGLKERDIDILSEPENGNGPQFTYLTSSKNIEQHVWVKVLPASDYQVILLCSDGFSVVEFIKSLKLKALNARRDFAQIYDVAHQITQNILPSDDASCIMMQY